MITITAPGRVKLDYGPLQMIIAAQGECGPWSETARQAAQHAMTILAELAEYRQIAARPQQEIVVHANWPVVLKRMIAAVQTSGDATLTPMAAVAGTIADLTADWLMAQGAVKAIVNNGGDIAVRLTGTQTTRVGIAPAIGHKPTHGLSLNAGQGIGGITTSGLGGRSFTKGIAGAAVVAGATAALADACATTLANATYVEHPAVKVAWAEELDPNTDIRGHRIVREVGLLPTNVVEQGLGQGYSKAADLIRQGLITGAAIFIQQQMVMVPDGFVADIT
jgi:ApbE superfamily uncharacterized protein (UPF0280 family)